MARRRARLGQHAREVALVVDRSAAVGDRRAVLGGDRPRLLEQLLRRRGCRAAAPRRGSAWTVVGPTALSAIPASAIVPPSIQTAAEAAAIAQSPARRSTFSCALPPPGGAAIRTSVSISPSPTAVMYGPRWNSSIADHALAVGAADHDLALDRRADRPQVLGRVGLAQRAADRAAVADDRVGDHLLGVGEQLCFSAMYASSRFIHNPSRTRRAA